MLWEGGENRNVAALAMGHSLSICPICRRSQVQSLAPTVKGTQAAGGVNDPNLMTLPQATVSRVLSMTSGLIK